MRVTSKLSVLSLVGVACLALVPAASADTITSFFVGSTKVGTVTLSTSGSSCGVSLSSTQLCVTFTATASDSLRLGGATIGFSGTGVSGSTTITNVSGGFSLDFRSTGCGGTGGAFCAFSTGSDQAASVTFVLNSASLSGTTVTGIHIIGPDCPGSVPGNAQTCFVTTTGPPSSVPEPGTLGLLGTGLVGLAGLVRRRLLS